MALYTQRGDRRCHQCLAFPDVAGSPHWRSCVPKRYWPERVLHGIGAEEWAEMEARDLLPRTFQVTISEGEATTRARMSFEEIDRFMADAMADPSYANVVHAVQQGSIADGSGTPPRYQVVGETTDGVAISEPLSDAPQYEIQDDGTLAPLHQCPDCDRTSTTRAGIVAHQRSHKVVTA